MNTRLTLPGYCLALIAVANLMSVNPALAEQTDTSTFGNVAIPSPQAPDNATACVEPTEIMRRDHMKFLLHQRDATVIDGIRSPRYSLVGCINCHNPAAENGVVLRYEDPKHFCAGCHLYASVSIDCFECHADRGLVSMQQGRNAGPVAWTSGDPPATFDMRLQGAGHVH